MKPIDANTAAFPYFPHEGGLTKREYIAALALQGMLSSNPDAVIDIYTVAEEAVLAADQLLAHLQIIK